VHFNQVFTFFLRKKLFIEPDFNGAAVLFVWFDLNRWTSSVTTIAKKLKKGLRTKKVKFVFS
jgi:hypothetical protein